MTFFMKAAAASRLTLTGFAAVLGMLLVACTGVTPAHSGEYYDRYERPYRYNDDYVRPRRYYGSWRPSYGVGYHCNGECGCGWRCGRPFANGYPTYRPSYYRPSYYRPSYYRPSYYRPAYRHGPDVIERRYVVREYVERRYAAPWRARYRSYGDDYDYAPRPPAPVTGLPASYEDYEE